QVITGTTRPRIIGPPFGPPNARINRARRHHQQIQVSRMKATRFAVRLNELLGLVRATSFRNNRSASRPVCITYSLEIHLEKAYRLLAGHDPVSDLPPSTILADRRVANRH